jgi:hypothetical protein
MICVVDVYPGLRGLKVAMPRLPKLVVLIWA